MNAVVLPADGQYLGDWQRGAEVAGNGRGLQSSDDPTKPNGGNCYACHQLAPDEVAYGNLGPSLTGYGARGQSQPMLRYTWTKLGIPMPITCARTCRASVHRAFSANSS